MGVIDGRTMLDVLSVRECAQLLGSTGVGRVGFVHDAHVEILPVAFANDGTTIWFRTAKGTKLDALVDWPQVGFEVDHFDEATREGWSVLLVAKASTSSTPPPEVAADERLRPWTPGPKGHWVRLEPETVTGRRLRPFSPQA
jgi:nitroimidazol reductase NimA-like FMN-containing flavoprotein (pyridoxamine 5'-phosphate oxidase superfamily)